MSNLCTLHIPSIECRNETIGGSSASVPANQIVYNQAIINGNACSAEFGREVGIVIPKIQ